jgi:NCAIR mutase (PurE)-related proteins
MIHSIKQLNSIDGNSEKESSQGIGLIAVCTGGTADIPVAEEAAETAEYFGGRVRRIYDVGVSGIHRVLSKADEIREANCVIVVAGNGRGTGQCYRRTC